MTFDPIRGYPQCLRHDYCEFSYSGLKLWNFLSVSTVGGHLFSHREAVIPSPWFSGRHSYFKLEVMTSTTSLLRQHLQGPAARQDAVIHYHVVGDCCPSMI